MNKKFDLYAIRKGYITITKNERIETFNAARFIKKPLKKILSKLGLHLEEYEEEKLRELINFINPLDEIEKNEFHYKILYNNTDNMFYDLTILEDDKYKFQDMRKYYEPDEYEGEILKPTHRHSLTIYTMLNGKKSGIFNHINDCSKEDVEIILRSNNFTDEEIKHLFDIEIKDYREYAPSKY